MGVSDSGALESSLWNSSLLNRTTPSRLGNANWGLIEMLTRKQYELLRFISERLKDSGVPPSFDDMKDALDLRSKSGIPRLITALEERGFIGTLPHACPATGRTKLRD